MRKQKVALITGITGQDGSYLADFLLKKDYVVHGVKRRTSTFNTQRIDYLYKDFHEKGVKFFLHHGDLSDSSSILRIISDIKPNEIYNLGAQSHVSVSFEQPEYTANSDALGTLRILEAIRNLKLEKRTKFYQASTSELFGLVKETPQNENTPFHPRSPYAVAKLYAHWITVNYREAYGLFACNGILFNHESPVRGETFVTRKITIGLSKIFKGIDKVLYLGNLNSKRDWGHAKDYVEMQWLMLQQKTAKDYVIATGKQYSIREFIELTLMYLGIKIRWKGKELNEIGIIDEIDEERLAFKNFKPRCKVGQIIIKIDPRYFRPSEVETLLGDASKARKDLGWKPKTVFKDLVYQMIKSDISKAL